MRYEGAPRLRHIVVGTAFEHPIEGQNKNGFRGALISFLDERPC